MTNKERAELLVKAANTLATIKLDYSEGETRRLSVDAILQVANELSHDVAPKTAPAPEPKKPGRPKKIVTNTNGHAASEPAGAIGSD